LEKVKKSTSRGYAAPLAASLRDQMMGLLAATVLALLTSACGTEPGAPVIDEAEPSPETRVSAHQTTADTRSGEIFVDRAASSGLDFLHFNGMLGNLYLAEITCSGGALFDADGDGDLDAYLLQGRVLDETKTVDDALTPHKYAGPVVDRLYRNELVETGTFGFTDITETMGVTTSQYGCGVATGDFNNDGALDIYVVNLGPNQLLLNQGDGTFEDVTERAGVGDDGAGSTAAFVDLDRDGWLDLFVGNYSDYFVENETECLALSGAPDYCGPGAYPFRTDRLYRNRGDGTFEDVTMSSGIGTVEPSPALGVVTGDFNGDQLPDLLVANDGEMNHLWLNQGVSDGGWVTFYEEALLAGCALNTDGQAEASMGIDAGDVDNDGDLDFIMAHLVKETNTFYENDGGGIFTDSTASAGFGGPSLPFTSFGTGFFDYDNDGWLDLFVASGAVVFIPKLLAEGDPFPLHQTNQLFRNLGEGQFDEVTDEAGKVFELSEVSRSAVFGDVENDGDVDILVVNVAAPARLLVNQIGQEKSWLGIRLVSGSPPRDALGAQAVLLRGGRAVAWRRARTDGSYAAARDPRIVFGLGDDPDVQGVRVVWPDGQTETFTGLETGRYQTLAQGQGGS
jgi:hypothetical protein